MSIHYAVGFWLAMLRDYHCLTVENRPVGEGLRLLRLRATEEAFTCLPGQFVMLDLPTERFFFRRPFSVLDVNEGAGTFDIYYKVAGQGTAQMAALQTGDALQILGPLGNGFPPLTDNTLLIGGGIGIAPLYFTALRAGIRQAQSAQCFYGVRSQQEVGLLAELQAAFGPRLHVATDDGSTGFHGNVCQLLTQHRAAIQNATAAYICGPTRMMTATLQLLAAGNPALALYVSLEEHMPCGTGACTGCVVPRVEGLPAKTCVEGPVFDARTLSWSWAEVGTGEKGGAPCRI